MSRLLFEEFPTKSPQYMKNSRLEKAVYLIIACLFLGMTVLCMIFSLYGLSAAVFAIFILLLLYWIWTIRREQQFIAIYEDKIRYKKAFPNKTVELPLAPSQYKILLNRPLPKSGYTVEFCFIDHQNQMIFQYKAVSLIPSKYQAKKADWETALFAIGCEVLDPEEMIVNL